MTTPTMRQIVERAMELWFQDQWRQGFQPTTNPEVDELRESGYISHAQSDLMTSMETKHEQWLNNEVEETNYGLLFDVELARKRGTFISGGRGCGKTSLGREIVERLIREGNILKVFDNSQAWRRSKVPNLIVVRPRYHKVDLEIDFMKSYVFDLSFMYIKDQKRFVEGIVNIEFNIQANLPQDKRQWHFYVFEEVELLVGTHNQSEEIRRLVCVGRNFRLSYIALAQRFQNVSPTLISLCGQLYFGQQHEENDLKKTRNWLRQRTVELEDLGVGEFLYKKGKAIRRIQTFEKVTAK